jgi:cleavage and polyadenylation specificity factor subunit 2
MKKKGTYDFDVDGRRGRDRMFPLAVRRKRVDEFGEVIRPEDYLRAEEKVDDNGRHDGVAALPAPTAGGEESDAGGPAVGKKRRWDESSSNALQPKHGGGAANKRANLLGIRSKLSDDGGDNVKSEEIDALDEVEDVEEVEVSGPARLVVTTEKVVVNLRLAFVDFSGLHDKRSLNMLIPLIQPRKLILVGGSREETMALADDCRKLLAPSQKEGETGVFTPEVGETVDASVDTNAWTLKLADSLVKKLKWQSVRGLSVVTITGQLLGLLSTADATNKQPAAALIEDGGAKKRQKTDTETTTTKPKEEEEKEQEEAEEEEKKSPPPPSQIIPTLDLLSNASLSKARSFTQPLHVGDLRLADLRREMQAAGYSAEFRGEGTLLVDGVVAVRKTAAGKIEVVGTAGDGVAAARQRSTLYEVRRVIYRNLAVVGA